MYFKKCGQENIFAHNEQSVNTRSMTKSTGVPFQVHNKMENKKKLKIHDLVSTFFNYGCWLVLMVTGMFLPTPLLAGQDAAPQLIFHASYDKYHAHADVAGGDPTASLDASLELRSTEGIRKSGLLVEKGERCTYAVKGNLNMQRATVSMWISPKNWKGEDKRYHHFFAVSGAGRKFRLILYVPGNQTACLYIESGQRNTPEFRTFRVCGKVNWSIGEWHKLDACWDATTAKIYIDGQLGQKLELPNVVFPGLEDSRFEVGTPWQGEAKLTHDPDDLMVVDEVKIWDDVLTGEEIAQNYAADRVSLSGEVPNPLTRVPEIAASEVKVDGVLDEAAWSKAGCVPIRIKPNGFSHDRECSALLLNGPDALYVGFRAPEQTRPLVEQVTARDGNVWNDDSFELFLWKAESTDPKDFFQFIVNVNGTVFDTLGKNTSWNADVICAGNQGESGWSVELAIPWAALGATRPTEGTVWRANLCRNWQNPSPLSPTFTAWANFGGRYGGGSGELIFTKADAVQLTIGEDLNAGSFVLDAATSGKTPLTCAVEATAKGRKTLSKADSLTGEGSVRVEASLVGFKDGVLSIVVADPVTKIVWSRWAMRLYVKEPIEVEYIPQVLSQRLTLRLDFGNLGSKRAQAVRAGQATFVVNVIGPQPDITSTMRFAVKSIRDEFSFPLLWVDGTYQFNYTLETDGNAPLSISGSLVKPPTDWLTSNAGITTQVLAPWQPMHYRNETVTCWNRAYVLDGPLPASMKNDDKDLLTQPVTLTLQTDTGASPLKVRSTHAYLQAPHRAEWRGAGDFGMLGGTATWESWMEYDGLFVTDLILQPPQQGWNIESLVMDIPLRADLAKYIRNPKRIPRGTGAWDGTNWMARFQPYVWIGTESEGIDFFFDSDANWLSALDDKPVVLTVTPDEARVQLKMIMTPAQAVKPLLYRFGFQATPVRPLMKNWRGFHYNSHGMKYLNYIGYSDNASSQAALYDVAHPDLLKSNLAKRMQDPVMSQVPTFIYGGATCGPNKNPTYDFFAPLWSNPYVGGFFNIKRRPHRDNPGGDLFSYDLVGVSQASSWTDFMMDLAEKLTVEYGQTCFYTDMDRLHPDANPLRGTGYTDAFGRTGPSYAIIERRQFYKRLTTIARNAPNGPGLYMAHSHDNLVLPYHGWADLFFPGENYSYQTYQKPYFYISELDPLAYRVELASQASGLNHVLLPQFERGSGDPQHRKVPEYTESLLAMCLVNDVVASAAYLYDPAVEVYWERRMRVGLEDDATDFIGYWEPNCPAHTHAANVWVSVYRPPDGSSVLALVNRNEMPIEVPVRVNWKTLGLNPGNTIITDEVAQASLVLTDGKMNVAIKGYNYALIWLRDSDRLP